MHYVNEDETPETKRMREQLQSITVELAKMIKVELRGVECGFALVLFDFGGKGNMAYAADGVREDLVKMFRELATKLEADKIGMALSRPKDNRS